MHFHFEPMLLEYRESVIDIFNYYIENSFAAYPETKVPYEFFDKFLEMSDGYPTIMVKDEIGEILGFGMLRAHNPIPTFSQTAEITYFIKPEYTSRGIGSKMLNHLVNEAKQKGISSILASISSLNEGSINFHRKNGFIECGRFKNVGRKKGQVFDTVWMQKML